MTSRKGSRATRRKRNEGRNRVVVHVEILVWLVIHVEVERRQVGCCPGRNDHVIRWQQSQLLTLGFGVVLRR